MKPYLVGERPTLFQPVRLWAYDDWLEEAAAGILDLRVRRMFYDEVECATVHRSLPMRTLLAPVLLFAVALVGIGLSFLDSDNLGLWAAVPVALGALAYFVFSITSPPYTLVIRAPGQRFETWLPRRRPETLQRLLQSIESYQSRHALPHDAAVPEEAPPPASPDEPPAP